MDKLATESGGGPPWEGTPKVRGRSFLWIALHAPELGAIATAIVLYIFFAFTGGSNGFLSVVGSASWIDTASQLGIVAIPVALLMIAGEFDLSIGSMIGAGSITVGIVTGYLHHPLWMALLIVAAIGVAVGLVNGFLVTLTNSPSFIVTLAMNFAIAGLGLVISTNITNTTSVTVETSGVLTKVFSGSWGEFDISIFWWAFLALVASWVLNQTRFGNWIFATGGDHERALRAGVATSRVKISLFVCTALAASFLGALQAISYNTGDPTIGQGYVFEAPIVIVIGGVLLSGGYGTIIGVVAGTVIYGILSAGLFYTGWNTVYAQVVIGVLLVIAVLTNKYLQNLALRGNRLKGTP